MSNEEQVSEQKIDEARRHYSRGIAFLKLGRFEEALSELDKALSLNPSNERYRLARIAALVGLERFEDAENELKLILLKNDVSSSIANSSHVNGVVGKVRLIVNRLSPRLMNFLQVASALLARVVNRLAELLNGLVARFTALLGLARAYLTRVVRLRDKDHRDAT